MFRPVDSLAIYTWWLLSAARALMPLLRPSGVPPGSVMTASEALGFPALLISMMLLFLVPDHIF